MRKGRLAGLVPVVALLALTAGCASNKSASSSDDGPIKLGILTERTGALASFGNELMYGVQAGVAQATNGTNEVAGRKIEFVIGDDRSEVGQSAGVARRLIQSEHPALVFGYGVTDAAVLTESIMRDANIPAIYSLSWPKKLSPLTYRTSRDYAQEAQMAALVADLGRGDRVQLLAPDIAYGKEFAEGFERQLEQTGATAVADPIYAPLVSNDYTSLVQRLKQSDADKLIVAGWAGSSTALLWRSIDRAGLADEMEMFTLLPQRPTRRAMGDVARKIGFWAIYDPDLPLGRRNDDFVRRYREVSGGKSPDIFSGDPGVAGQVAVAALEETRGDTDPEAISEALDDMAGEGVKGPFAVRSEDHLFLHPFFKVSLGPDYRAKLEKAYTKEQSEIPVGATSTEE